MPQRETVYASFLQNLKELSLISSTASVLGWDEQTQMPTSGASFRGDQMAMLARLAHEKLTSERFQDPLGVLEASLVPSDEGSDFAVNVRQTRRSVDKAVKLPVSLVSELTRVSILSEHAWVEARRTSDYSAFAPWLQTTIDLKKQQAACYGSSAHPYDALLDEYEPGYTTAELTQVFSALREPLVNLIRKISESGRKNDSKVLTGSFPKQAQETFARNAAERIGFDFARGRLDVSTHPFCTTLGPNDVRLTTRYDEGFFASAFFGVLHEAGHGMYNQGLPEEHFHTPRGSYVSTGIHESQSRLWENLVGRSRPFWKHFFPKAKEAFPTIADVSEDPWYRAINRVSPGFIRVEADETTYNLHILLRFEMETALISGNLSVADVPREWNEKMKRYLGVTPPSDALGCLQDIHWPAGLFGYFPTYTLGNLYASQFFAQARLDLGDVDAQFAAGNFAPLLEWLRKSIHQHGQRFTARQLVERVSGKALSPDALIAHLTARASEVFGVS